MADLLLTIITVTKNCEATINRTLDSVSAVKRPGVEYIVVDGASTDATLHIISSWDGLVDCLISEPDEGIYNAMNKGVRLANGRYVLFINGDDSLVADGFSVAMGAMARAQGGIICTSTLVGGVCNPTEILVAEPSLLPFFNSIPHPSSFVLRELLLCNPFSEDLRIASDYDFFLSAYLARVYFCILPVVTALHHRGGASGNIELSLREVHQVRRNRLRWRFPFFEAIVILRRFYKFAIRRKLEW
jgi:glycosyltransferase involved in cell wall biosynthesis